MIHIIRLFFMFASAWLVGDVGGDTTMVTNRMAPLYYNQHQHHDPTTPMRIRSMMRKLLRQPNHPWWALMKESLLNVDHNQVANGTILDLETIDKLLGLLEEEVLLESVAGMRMAELAKKSPALHSRNLTQRQINLVQSSIWSTMLITATACTFLGLLLLSVRVFWAIRAECRARDWSMKWLASTSGLSLIMHHFRHEMYGTALPPPRRFANSFNSFSASASSSSRSSMSADGFELLPEPLPLWHRFWRWSISWVPGNSLTQPKNQLRLIEEIFPSQQQQQQQQQQHQRGSVQGRKRMSSIKDHTLNDGWHETLVNRRLKASSGKRHSLPHLSSPSPVVPVEQTIPSTPAIEDDEVPVLTTLTTLTDQSDESVVYRHQDDEGSRALNLGYEEEEEEMLMTEAEEKEEFREEENEREDYVEPSSPSVTDFLPSPQPSPSPTMMMGFAIEHLDTAQDPIHVPSGRRSLPPMASNVTPMPSAAPANSNSKLLRRLASHSPTAMDDLGQSKLARFFVNSVAQRSVASPIPPPPPPPPTPIASSTTSGYDSIYGGIPSSIFGRRAATPIPTPPPSRRPTPSCEVEQRLRDGDLTPPPGLVRRPQSIHHLSAEIFDDGRTSATDFFEQRRRLHLQQQQQQQQQQQSSGFGAVGARPRPY